MDRCSDCDESCDVVCLKKPAEFTRDLIEVGGFGHYGIPELLQRTDSSPIPRYVPVIQHGYSRNEDIPLKWAAIPLHELVRMRSGVYGPAVKTEAALRAKFKLPPDASIILLGIGKDKSIEPYWRWRRGHKTSEKLAQLGLAWGVVPNYSCRLLDPRPQHLFNRKRSLICAAEWSREGLPTIPYLQTMTEADWLFWERFLRVHPEVRVVAKEFQTGLATPERGDLAIDRLSRLQDSLGRPLHVMTIAAAQYRKRLSKLFESWTILDSVPFLRAMKRRVFGRGGERIKWMPAVGESVDDLLVHNVSRYSDWISRTRP